MPVSANNKRNRYVFCVAVLILFTLLLSGCNKNVDNFIDNSGNFINGGTAAATGKKVIFTDGKSIFEIDKQNNSKKITTIKGNIQGFLNIYENSIYFFGNIKKEGEDKKVNGYYSYNTETEEINLILPYKPLGVIHYQDTIYFINPIDKNTIYMCTNEGKQLTKVSDETVMSIAMDSQYIYYVSGLDLALYRMNHDGSDVKDLKCKGVVNMMRSDGKIYYKDGYNSYKLTIVNTDGSGKKMLLEKNIYSYNVKDGVVYFSSEGGTFSFNSDDSDDKTETNLLDDMVVHINIAGNQLFYLKLSDGRMYRSNLDGTNEVLIQE